MNTIDQMYTSYLEYNGDLGHIIGKESFLHVKTFVNYCRKVVGCKTLCQKYVDKWCAKRPTESINSRNTRVSNLRQFLKYTNTFHGTAIAIPKLVNAKPYARNLTMTELPLRKSVVSEHLARYIEYLRSIQPKICGTTHKNLVRFNNHCAKNYPEANKLTEEILASWCDRRPTERCSSRNTRVLPIRGFLKHAVKRGWLDVRIPDRMVEERTAPRQPHGFTEDELQAFFHKAANLTAKGWGNDIDFKIRRMQIPVYMLTLLSTGMRTNEARMLKRSDVDLENGIVSVEATKGYDQHRVAIHPSLLNLLKRYDSAMEKLIPDRNVFFPNKHDEYHSIAWQANQFRKIWNTISSQDARAYDFRSYYAVTNINRWNHDGTEWLDKLLILARTMGHKRIESTCYYYQLAPMFNSLLEEISGPGLKSLLPENNIFEDDEDKE